MRRQGPIGAVPGAVRAMPHAPDSAADGSTVGYTKWRLPAKIQDYRPDANEAIDRWFQAANSSNVRTTLRIIANVCPTRPTLVVDPFAGAGSAAVAARQLRVPFFGLDTDPVLVCVTVAKALAGRQHVDWIKNPPVDLPTRDRLVAECLGLVIELRQATGQPLTLDHITADLQRSGVPHSASAVYWADATSTAGWSGASRVDGGVIYCSPPFGVSSPRPHVPEWLHEKARQILKRGECAKVDSSPAVFDSYSELAAGMLRQARQHLGSTFLIMEYEPADGRVDHRKSIVERLRDEPQARIGDVLFTRAFSDRGLFSLIHGDIGAVTVDGSRRTPVGAGRG